MTLHLGLPHTHHRSAEQQHEIREARRMLKERIRDDWDYPPLPAYQTPTLSRKVKENDINARIAGFKFHAQSGDDGDGLLADLDFEPVEWRERDYSSEEDGEEAEAEVKQGRRSADTRATSTSSADHHSHHKKLSSIFKFEGPDSVGHQIEERKAAKRQKRQKALDEEVEWNDGLAHWLARRDAWCCARTTSQVAMLGNNKSQSSVDATAAASLRSAGTSPRTSTSTASSTTPSAAASSPSTTPDIAPSTSPPAATTTLPTQPAAPPSHTLIPLAPRLLPDHPIRKRINPDLYPEIYSKIIISGRTPSVPINLFTLTRALVQGWKDDGEWPPKQGPVEKSIGRKKGGKEGGESSLKSGVRAVGRVLRITGTGAGGEGARERDKG